MSTQSRSYVWPHLRRSAHDMNIIHIAPDTGMYVLYYAEPERITLPSGNLPTIKSHSQDHILVLLD